MAATPPFPGGLGSVRAGGEQRRRRLPALPLPYVIHVHPGRELGHPDQRLVLPPGAAAVPAAPYGWRSRLGARKAERLRSREPGFSRLKFGAAELLERGIAMQEVPRLLERDELAAEQDGADVGNGPCAPTSVRELERVLLLQLRGEGGPIVRLGVLRYERGR